MFALLLAACTRMALEGTVVDVRGEPVEGARVTAIPSQCQASSDAEGHFEMACATGTYEIVAARSGFISARIDAFDATERKRYDLGRLVLVPLPEETGLLLFDAAPPRSLEPAWLERRKGRGPGGPTKAYCLPPRPEQPALVLEAGQHVFFDNRAPDWRLFRLDDRGCAWRMAREGGRWTTTYAERVEVERKVLEPERSLVRVALEPGRYFVAWWENGFFARGTWGEGRTGYRGALLEVRPAG